MFTKDYCLPTKAKSFVSGLNILCRVAGSGYMSTTVHQRSQRVRLGPLKVCQTKEPLRSTGVRFFTGRIVVQKTSD